MLCFLSLEFSGPVGKTDHLPWQLMWCVKSWYLTPFRIPKRGIFWSVQRIRRSLVTVRWVIQNCYSNLFIIIIVFHFIRFYYFFGRGLIKGRILHVSFCFFRGEGVFGWILPEICILRNNRMCFEHKSHLWKTAAKNSEATFLLMKSCHFSFLSEKKIKKTAPIATVISCEKEVFYNGISLSADEH